jgi:tetratricopeptide (TPR) repeat protein
LRRLKWIEPAGRGHFNLTGLALSVLRREAEEILSGTGVEAGNLTDAIQRLVQASISEPSTDRASIDVRYAIEEAANWLLHRIREKTPLTSMFQRHVVISSIGEPLAPYTPAEESELMPTLDREAVYGSLDSALATLALIVQAPQAGRQNARLTKSERFLRSASVAQDLVKAAEGVSALQLRALDVALYFGAKYYRTFSEVLSCRLSVTSRLSQQAELKVVDRRWTTWWISWKLNVASLHLELGEFAKARPLLDDARELLEKLLPCGHLYWSSSWSAWLQSRIEMLELRLTRDPEQRLERLRRISADVAESLPLTAQEPRWLISYTRAVRRLVRELKDDDLRRVAVDHAIQTLENNFGQRSGWHIGLRTQVAALLRFEARIAWREENRRPRALEAIELLRATALGSLDEVRENEYAALLEVRLLRFLGMAREAEDLCDQLLGRFPSASAWHLKLKLAEVQRDRLTNPNHLREAITDFQSWLEQSGCSDLASALASLWVKRRHWSAQGSIGTRAAQMSNEDELEFSRLSVSRKKEYLERVYQDRLRSLERIEAHFGTFVELTRARVDNEAQYQRSLASVLRTGRIDTSPVFKEFEKGLEYSPGNHRILFDRGLYYRYLHDYKLAIGDFERIIIATLDVELRRRSQVCLAETLLVAGKYVESLDLSRGRLTARELLLYAKEVAAEVRGHSEVAREMAILRDQIALEIGETIDWSPIDSLFRLLGGGIEGFPNVMIRNLPELWAAGADSKVPEQLYEFVQREFTDPDALENMGNLYLRSVETGRTNDALRDLNAALALFNAASTFQRSWNGYVQPRTTASRARAILTAAQSMHDTNPICDMSSEGKIDQLMLAEALLQSVASRSTGLFRIVVEKDLNRARSLRRELVGWALLPEKC